MSKDELRAKMGAFHDGELDANEEALVRREIADSTELQDEFDRLRRTTGNLRRYFESAHEEVASADLAEELAVERIVKESTMAWRRQNGAAAASVGRSFIMKAAVGLVIMATLFLLGRALFFGDPDPAEMVTRAGKELEQGFYEVSLNLPRSISGFVEMIGEQQVQNLIGGGMRVGPQGLMHFRVHSVANRDQEVHAGFDGQRAWSYASGDDAVRLFERQELIDNPIVTRALAAWRAAQGSLTEAMQHPEALVMVGKMKDLAGDDLWKVRLGGSQSENRASYWFDHAGKLRRIRIGALEFELKEALGLSAASFQIETILPGVEVPR